MSGRFSPTGASRATVETFLHGRLGSILPRPLDDDSLFALARFEILEFTISAALVLV